MEKKWKAFIMKYRDFCIAAGIVGFLLGPFLWPFFSCDYLKYPVAYSADSAGI